MENLRNSLKLGITCPIYLFYGDEPLLMEEALASLAALVVPDGADWDVETFNGDECTPDQAVEAVSNSGLFGGKRLVVVKNVPWFRSRRKKNEEENEEAEETEPVDLSALLAYTESPNPDGVLVLMASGKVPKHNRALKAIQAAGRVAEFTSPKGDQRDKWLYQYFRSQGKPATREACQYLAMICGEGLGLMRSEADKLILYCTDRSEVVLEDVREIASSSAEAAVFDLTNQVAGGKAAEAVRTLRRLMQQGEIPQKLIGLLAGQFRSILLAGSMAADGLSQDAIVRQAEMNPYYTKKCLAMSRRFPPARCRAALGILLKADVDSKSGAGDAAELLEAAVMQICVG